MYVGLVYLWVVVIRMRVKVGVDLGVFFLVVLFWWGVVDFYMV